MTRGRELRELKDSLNFKRKTPEGRPARRRAEEKDASDESTVLEYSFTVSLSGFVPAGD